MKAHLVQLDIAWEDKAASHRRVDRLLQSVEVARGDLIVLPEMFDTGFSMHVERTHDADRATLDYCATLATRMSAYVHGGRTVMHDDGWARNQAIVLSPEGRVVCEYEKIHPFSFGKETERFRGGHRVLTWDWPTGDGGLKVCPAVCYDLRFPELFREGLGLGAEVFVVGANWPSARAGHWRALLAARAIENQAWVIGVNRAGRDPFLEYEGGSAVVSPTGVFVAEAGAKEMVTSCEIDPAAVRQWRAQFPAWRDRRLGVERTGQGETGLSGS